MEKMTFEQKLTECEQNLRAISLNSYTLSEREKYADFVELLVLFNKGEGISKGDVKDILFGENDDVIESDDEKIETDNVKTIITEEKNNDNKEDFINNIFKLLNERFTLFAELYPFKQDNDSMYLKKEINNGIKIYIFLLFSSTLNVFKSFQTELTTDFETVSYEALKQFIPSAEVKQFGKNSEYTGNAKTKIRKLAKDLGLPIDNYEISQVGERNNQERGLDIIGWLPFMDNCQNKMVFLCQCACGKYFGSKQHDTRRFEHYYVFYRTKPQHTLFIPASLININENKFYHSDDVEDDYLVFERKRIVSLLKDNNICNQLLSKDLVEKCFESSL